jgi:hypothetical protein
VIAALCLPTIPVLTLIAALLLAIWTVVTSTFILRAEMRAAPGPDSWQL